MKQKVIAKCIQRKEVIKDPSKGKQRVHNKYPIGQQVNECNWRIYGKMVKEKNTFQVISLTY